MRFAESHHQLATPLAAISFKEEADRAAWTIAPLPHPEIDAALYRFIVALQFGIVESLHRDVMGPTFEPRVLEAAYPAIVGAPNHLEAFGRRLVYKQAENRLIFDAKWLDGVPKLGSELTYSMVLSLCDQMMEELEQRAGIVGQVREALLVNLARPTGFEAVAKHLNMAARTLRRRLTVENTSLRAIFDELRMQMAIKYLRDTDLTVEDIAGALGFSDAANFRQAFRRWTNGAPPNQFRRGA
jgi:AraC-like DNA-binding protein